MMKNKNKLRFLTAVLAVFLCLCGFSVTAYAGGGEDIPEETEAVEAVTETEATETEANPFTPEGTGTVVDNATDADGKEFYTITTDAGNIFYLIIDNERETDNVYFLNAVTEDDLFALAETSDGTGGSTNTVPAADTQTSDEVAAEPEAEAAPEPDESAASSNTGAIVFVVLIALAAGGAGYYFKILRPKQQAEDGFEDDEDMEDMEYGEEPEDYGDEYGEEADGDFPGYEPGAWDGEGSDTPDDETRD